MIIDLMFGKYAYTYIRTYILVCDHTNKRVAACVAYSRYILDIGQSEDWLALQVALSPCLIGYGAIAKKLHCDENTALTGNRYWKWIDNYVAEDYVKAVEAGSGKVSVHVCLVSPLMPQLPNVHCPTKQSS